MFYQTAHLGTSDYFKKECGENFNYPPHLHQSFELILVTSGTMTVRVGEKEYTLGGGEAVLIFPNQTHSMTSRESTHTLFIFSPQFVQAFWTEKKSFAPENNKLQLDRYMIEKLRGLAEKSSRFEIKGVLYSVVAEFDKEATYREASRDKEILLVKIFGYVEGNFKKDCSLGALGASVGYSAEYVSRYFKKKTTLSYNQYLNVCRLNHAAHMLRNTDETALVCALESGYTSLRTFNRNFKYYYGVTPQEYRKNT